MSLSLFNGVKYGVSGTPGTGTATLASVIAGFLALPTVASGTSYVVAYFAEDVISGANVVEVGDGTLTWNGTAWSLTRNVLQSSAGLGTALSLTSNAQIGLTFRAGDYFGLPAGFVNKLRNGCFDIWQRGTSITATTSGAYTADGWIVKPTGASVTVTQDATRSNDENLLALKIAGAASVTDVKLVQRIESFIAAPLAGKTCTVKFKVYNGKASGTLTPQLILDHASAVDNFGTVSNDLAATNLQVCANGAWTTVAYTFTAGANVINGMQVSLDVGALGAGDFVEVTSTDIRETPFVATGLCATSPIAEKRPIHIEMAFCQRYVFSTYGNNVAPGTATATGASYFVSVVAFTFDMWPIPFAVSMRTIPAVTAWSTSGATGNARILSPSSDVPVTTPGASFSSANIVVNNTNIVAGATVQAHIFATAEL